MSIYPHLWFLVNTASNSLLRPVLQPVCFYPDVTYSQKLVLSGLKPTLPNKLNGTTGLCSTEQKISVPNSIQLITFCCFEIGHYCQHGLDIQDQGTIQYYIISN